MEHDSRVGDSAVFLLHTVVVVGMTRELAGRKLVAVGVERGRSEHRGLVSLMTLGEGAARGFVCCPELPHASLLACHGMSDGIHEPGRGVLYGWGGLVHWVGDWSLSSHLVSPGTLWMMSILSLEFSPMLGRRGELVKESVIVRDILQMGPMPGGKPVRRRSCSIAAIVPLFYSRSRRSS